MTVIFFYLDDVKISQQLHIIIGAVAALPVGAGWLVSMVCSLAHHDRCDVHHLHLVLIEYYFFNIKITIQTNVGILNFMNECSLSLSLSLSLLSLSPFSIYQHIHNHLSTYTYLNIQKKLVSHMVNN